MPSTSSKNFDIVSRPLSSVAAAVLILALLTAALASDHQQFPSFVAVVEAQIATTVSTTLTTNVTGPTSSILIPSTTTSTTTMMPTTTAVPATPATTKAASDTSYTGLDGSLTFDWTLGPSGAVISPNINNNNITLEITSTQSNQYKAMAWAQTESGMGPGLGFACVVLTSPSTTARCRDIVTTFTRSVSLASEQVTNILSYTTLSSGGWTMRISTTNKALNMSYKNSNNFSRVLIATGTWSTATDMPNPHQPGTSYRASPYVNFVSGGAMASHNSPHNTLWRFKVTLGVCFFVFLLLGIAGAMLKSKHENSGPKTALFLKGFGLICVVCSFVACLIAAIKDGEEFGDPNPLNRAFGAACLYPFSIILFPAQKLPTIFNIGYFAGSSYERFINLHVVTGLLLYVLVVIHFALIVSEMTKVMPFADTILVTNGHRPLFAFIGFVCLNLMVITGLLRRKFYALFRYTHILAPVTIGMFCLHFPLLIVAVIPGSLCYIIDFTWRIITERRANTQVVSVVHNAYCGVTQLRVRITDDDYEVGPGQFALVTCYSVSPIAHPFTIANFNPRDGQCTFYIKNLGGSWTKRFSELAAAQQITAVSISRPIGQLGINISASPVIYLCAGGIGITPILSIATYIGHEIREGNITGLHTVHIIWSVREESLVEMMMPELTRVIGAIELRGVADESRSTDDVSIFRSNQTAVNCSVYMTGGRKGGAAMRSATQQQEANQSPSADAMNGTQHASTRRHDNQHLDELLMGSKADDELDILLGGTSPRNGAGNNNHNTSNNNQKDKETKQAVKRNTVSKLSGRPKFDQIFGSSRGEGLTVSVFSCGPAPFMKEVYKQAVDYDCLLHEETFEL